MLLTLFSKFFSPFPHGTCALSVCCFYFVLYEIYHMLKAAFPSNPTRRKYLGRKGYDGHTGFSPSATAAFQPTLPSTFPREYFQIPQLFDLKNQKLQA